MPVEFRVGDILEILRRGGKFTLAGAAGSIAAANSLGAAPTAPSTVTPHVEITLTAPNDMVFLTERFNWGRSDGTGYAGAASTDSLFYELHMAGRPTGRDGKVLLDFFGQEVGYYCSAVIRPSCIDNVCTHILAAQTITLKLWNITSPAAAAAYDFTVWYMLLKKLEFVGLKDYFDQVKAIEAATRELGKR